MPDVKSLVIGVVILGSVLTALGQDECCPSRAFMTSIEGWFFHNNTYLGLSYWTNERSSTSIAIGPGAPLVLQLKAATSFRKTCVIDIRFFGILGLPLGAELNWQTLDLGVGVELCLPSIPEFALEIGGGFYLHHYKRCSYWNGCWWAWASGTFTLLSLKAYF